jgi:hypothetical protein
MRESSGDVIERGSASGRDTLQAAIRAATARISAPATHSTLGGLDAPTATVCRDGQGGDSYRTEGTVAILERIRPGRRPIQVRQLARDLMNRDRSALEHDAAAVVDQVKDIRVAAADAIETVQRAAVDAVERAGDAVGDAVDTITTEATKSTKGAAGGVTKGAKDLELDKQLDRGLGKVDGRVDDLVERIRQALPTDRITTLVTNLERDLPTTDGDKYDRAFRRGFARARTSFVVIGAAAGIAAGIAGAYLLDPQRGPYRRERLRTTARRTTKDVSRQVRRTARMTTDRAKGFAYERGILKPEASDEEPAMRAEPAPLVPVMDPAATGGARATPGGPDLNGEPAMPPAGGRVTDPSSIEREPMATREGGLIGGVASPAQQPGPSTGTPSDDLRAGTYEADDARLSVSSSAVTSSLEPQAEDATITGEESDRGTWHRTL